MPFPVGPARIDALRRTIARIEKGARPRGEGAVCEILPARPGDAAAACGCALALARAAAGERGAIVWIGEDFVWRERGAPYGPGLAAHGVDPGRLVLTRVPGPRQALWAMEEALKSGACAAVIGEVADAVRHCDLLATRRLSVAARAGGCLGLLVYPGPVAGDLSTAARARLEVATAPGRTRASAGRRRPIPVAPVWRLRALKGRPLEGLVASAVLDSARSFAWTPAGGFVALDSIPPAVAEGAFRAALSFPRDRARA
jgi:hypothetical protein